MSRFAALPISYVVLRLLLLLNIFWGAAILLLVGATVVARAWTLQALGIGPESGITGMLGGLQAIAGLGLLAMFLTHCLLRRLIGIVETVGRGDPFVPDNAYRLHAIGWFLLGLQLASMAIALIGKAISTPEHPLHLDAGFSPMGWLAVLLTFVLARVFAEGALMREDLEGTV